MHAERRREASRSRRRERVVRSCRVVAERHGGVGAHEHRACVLDLGREASGVAGHDQKVLGSEVIGHLHRLLHVLSHDDAAVGLADDVRALQSTQKTLELLLDPIGELGRIGDQDAPRKGIVLELCGKVGGDEVRPCLGICDHNPLGRTRDPVHTHRPENLFLGQGHVDIAGTRDDIHARDALRSVGERRDGLRPSHPVHGIDARDVRGGEDRRGHATVGSRGRGQDHLGNLRHAGRDHRHEHGRRIGRAAARRVDPGASDGSRHKLQTGQPYGSRLGLALVEVADAPCRELEGGPVCRWQTVGRRRHIVVRHLERLTRLRRPPIESTAELAQRLVALGQHPSADFGHGLAFFRELRQVEPPPRQRRVQPRADVEPSNRHWQMPLAFLPPLTAPPRYAF